MSLRSLLTGFTKTPVEYSSSRSWKSPARASTEEPSVMVMRNFSPLCLGPMSVTTLSGVPSPKKILRLRYTMCFCRYMATASVVQKYFMVSGIFTRSSSAREKKASMT